MTINYNKIEELLRKKSDFLTRLKNIPYNGYPEVKKIGENSYLYIRKRVFGKNTSTYVGLYSDELYNLLINNSNKYKKISKEIKKIEKELLNLGYIDKELSIEVYKNIEFAKANIKNNIYEQAILEGITTTFLQTEKILENGFINNIKPIDVQKILNLKHAWDFILDKDVLTSKSDLYLLCFIARLVNEGFFLDGGRIRSVPVKISGCSYMPPIPIEADIKEEINKIISEETEAINIAIKICLFCMKKQIFIDGNKRASVIFANHFLISRGGGMLIIPENEVNQFRKLLVRYYDGEDINIIYNFLKENCWRKL